MALMNPIGPGDVAPRAGRLIGGLIGLALLASYPDADAQQLQVSTVTAGGATGATAYSLRVVSTTSGVVFDRTYSVTTAGSTSAALLAEQLEGELRDDAALGALVSDISRSSGVITITGADRRTFAVTFPVNPSTHLSVSTVAPGYQTYLYGRAVEITAAGARKPVLPTRATVTWDLTTNNNSQAISTRFAVVNALGVVSSRTFSATSGANAGATTTAIVAALGVTFPEASVAITVVDDVVVATLPPGYSVAQTDALTLGTVVATIAIAAPAALPQLALVHVDGVTPAQESWTGPADVLGPIPGSPVQVWQPTGGIEMAVSAPGSVSLGAPVYCDTDGVLYDSVSPTRILLRGVTWRRNIDPNIAVIGG